MHTSFFMGFLCDKDGMKYGNGGGRITASNVRGCRKEGGRIKEQSKKRVGKTIGEVTEGRKTDLGTKAELQRKITEYFESYLTESGEIADIESLADYLGTTRDELNELIADGKYGKIIRLARNKIAKIKKQLAFGGKIPAAVLSFDLKNNHGYRDKPEEVINDRPTVIFKGSTSDWAK